jgi:hypothetical protein
MTKAPEQEVNRPVSWCHDSAARWVSWPARRCSWARVELSEEVVKGVKVTAALSASALVGLVALVFVSSAAAWGLAEVMAPGWAFLVVAAVQLAVAGVLFLVGRRQAAEVDPVPHQTVETLKEDAQWAKNPTS